MDSDIAILYGVATRTTISIIEAFARIKTLSRNIRELPNVRDENEKQNLLKKSSEVITELLDNDLKVNEIETSIEVNFAVLKIKHTVKKNKQNN